MRLNKFLPYVYAISGAYMASNLDSLLAFHAGVLLMLVACLIWIKQLEHQ
jgi:hypothetical protein